MKNSSSDSNEIKVKKLIRNLKKEETRMICSLLGIETVSLPLIWSQYFELNKPYNGNAKYNLDELVNMNKTELDQVVNDYFNAILNSIYKRETINAIHPIFNMPKDSDIEDVKKHFRELSKKMHPDVGGTHEEFIELSQAYDNFIKNIRK